ncbi:PAAR domain-containing protein [Cupriavidus basilensis]|uniref:PAAR domain-containing protein n=1 Tax=Cupriavidus basilensis TaxID=68895 RepID=UPI0039F734DA
MGKKLITVGDTTTHGGKVISGSEKHLLRGRPVARKGDLVDCPQRYPDGRPHGINKIVEGDEKFLIGGWPAALDSHRTECGCQLIGSLPGVVGG